MCIKIVVTVFTVLPCRGQVDGGAKGEGGGGKLVQCDRRGLCPRPNGRQEVSKRGACVIFFYDDGDVSLVVVWLDTIKKI